MQESTCPILMFGQIVRIELSKCLKAFQSHLLSPNSGVLSPIAIHLLYCTTLYFLAQLMNWFDLIFSFFDISIPSICAYISSFEHWYFYRQRSSRSSDWTWVDWADRVLEYYSSSKENRSLHCIMSKPILCKCAVTVLLLLPYISDGTMEQVYYGKRSLSFWTLWKYNPLEIEANARMYADSTLYIETRTIVYFLLFTSLLMIGTV